MQFRPDNKLPPCAFQYQLTSYERPVGPGDVSGRGFPSEHVNRLEHAIHLWSRGRRLAPATPRSPARITSGLTSATVVATGSVE